MICEHQLFLSYEKRGNKARGFSAKLLSQIFWAMDKNFLDNSPKSCKFETVHTRCCMQGAKLRPQDSQKTPALFWEMVFKVCTTTLRGPKRIQTLRTLSLDLV
jgi:hypothetical protein